jgi:hypothetical protein
VCPGEAQRIDRVVETFAKRYTECNPGAFESVDAAQVHIYLSKERERERERETRIVTFRGVSVFRYKVDRNTSFF